MKGKKSVSRRDFMRSSALASMSVIGASAVSGHPSLTGQYREVAETYINDSLRTTGSVTGLLFSQIGYETGMPVRIIVRLPEKEMLGSGTQCRLASGELEYIAPVQYWGELWGSHWWISEFGSRLNEAVYRVEIREGGKVLLSDGGLEVRERILWDKTIELSAVDMLERRVHFTNVGAGWQDAGTLWVESCAQSGMIIALEDLLEFDADRFPEEFVQRLEKQIITGCNYLVMTQEKASELGYPEGAFTHDLHGHEHDILPNDANKAVVALMRASRLLSGKYAVRKTIYREAGEKAFQWLTNDATPLGEYGYQRFQRGIPEDSTIPDDEWVTRDLVMMCWASLERWKVSKDTESRQWCHHYAQKIMERQIPEEQSEHGFYGHFYEFNSLKHSESAWIHGIVPSENGAQFGTDLGGFFPNYLIPVIEMVRLWPDHQEAVQWKNMLANFTDGYLKPACMANPFYLVPLGIYGVEGPNWFCGTFHGTNAIYGFTAALALELFSILADDELIRIAYGNLQWIAGLNGGVTRENLKKGCVIFSMDIDEDLASPASMICHIGNRWAGTWFQTRGVICNGFSVGEQFKFDVAVKRENDGPHSLTDEDWIPHSAGWVAGLVRLNNIIDQLNTSTM